ncbi:RIB43A-like with coiled-coils protein 2 [Anopheles marshallii]|uniref:RIB43A-like with coiled-coils protein 2 n=1 Tax=Anopheles marshallii TaxID=1521116 RepID=UPI00237B3DC9|nr:RIB43A-like with coiled-coils protein 2 [Anopheles marshallii]
MLNSLFINHQDQKEALAIERRRRFEESRKQRIFNARRRLIGVDTDTLGYQIQEKHETEQAQAEQQRKFAEEMRRQEQVLLLKQREQRQERIREENELNRFRASHQNPEQSRDFDLFDPDGLKKSLPARLGDDDPRLSVSGAQIFDGEDLEERHRRKVQVEQQRSWLEQQIREKRQAEIDRRAAEKFLEDSLMSRENRLHQLATQERYARGKIHEAVNEFNRRLMNEQEQQRMRREREEQEDNLAEIYNNLTSDILTENPDVAKSSFGPNRVITAQYKGMSPEEIEQIRRTQELQLEQLKRKRENEDNTRKAWDQLANDFDRTVTMKERELNRRRHALAEQIRQENHLRSLEQQRKLQHLDKVVYQNRPTQAYFDQFNTCSR